MLTEILTIIIGVVVILVLADFIVNKAIKLAKHFGLSGTFVGLTLLSIGTSIPEIMTHIIGSAEIVRDSYKIDLLSGLLLGTSTGSDIFQQTFILGLLGSAIGWNRKLLEEVLYKVKRIEFKNPKS